MNFDCLWTARTSFVIPKPLTDEELDILQNEYQVKLPDLYRSFLQFIGNTSDEEFGDLEVHLRRVRESNSMIRTSYIEDSGLVFPPHRFVISADQGISLGVLDLNSLEILHLDAIDDEPKFVYLSSLEKHLEAIFSIPGLDR